MDITDDTRSPATVKEMLIELSGKFDVLNTELKNDRVTAADAIVRVYRELDEAREEREAMKVDIREVRDRKYVTPMALWGIVLGFSMFVTAAAGVVIAAISALK